MLLLVLAFGQYGWFREASSCGFVVPVPEGDPHSLRYRHAIGCKYMNLSVWRYQSLMVRLTLRHPLVAVHE